MTLDQLHDELTKAENALHDHIEGCPTCTAYTHTPTRAQLRTCAEMRRLDDRFGDLGMEHYEHTTKRTGGLCPCEPGQQR